MLKSLFVTCLLGTAVLSAMASEDGSVTFTYANDDFTSWGKSKSEIYDVAIRIDDPALVGKKITGIRALLNAYEGLESTSLWLSKELTLEKAGNVKVTVPDIYSSEAAIEKIDIPGVDHSVGQLSVALDTPYVLTDEGVYVGYSLTVPTVENGVSLTDGQKSPVLLSPSENAQSLYVRASKDFLKWLPYNDRLGCAAAIYVSLEGELAEYSVGIKELSNAKVTVDRDFTVKAKLANVGGASFSSLGFTYTIAGNTHEGNLEFATPVAPNLSGEISVDLPIEKVTELGDFDLDVTINKVNGQSNDNILASASCVVSVLPFVPVHRPLVEEFTGTWCGWCPRGYVALELLAEEYGDGIVLAAYHDSDPMQADDFPLDPDSFGFPSAILNRGDVEDPYLGKGTKGFGMKNDVKASLEESVLADIQVKAWWDDEEKTKIGVSATSTFLEDKENAGYKVGFLLISNGLSGKEASWTQSNYFAGNVSAYGGTDLEVLTTWPGKVRGLVFNDVVVATDGFMGVEGSVPEDVVYNEPYTTLFSYDIAANSIVQDKNMLYVAAFILNPDGTVLNANKTHVEGSNAIVAIVSDAAEVSAEYYGIDGSRVKMPKDGVFVKIIRMSDGSIRAEKILR
ncbi:MAG: hypothetical protein K2N48_07905 [Muribaculaceae bacterium]|nr:hypothetical protein [Muribaculaceae bacterium]